MTTREKLLQSTQALLWERGYVATSPHAIQLHAGVGQGSMYHHFRGKADLALAAIEATAREMRAKAEDQLGGAGTAMERISAYLHRERDVLRGCPIGRHTQDPEVMADPTLRRPIEETLAWLRGRLAMVLAEGTAQGDLDPQLDPDATAATLVAVLQGGYVLARAADSPEPFHAAIDGALGILAGHAPPNERTRAPR